VDRVAGETVVRQPQVAESMRQHSGHQNQYFE
jgi:hypothetical protein